MIVLEYGLNIQEIDSWLAVHNFFALSLGFSLILLLFFYLLGKIQYSASWFIALLIPATMIEIVRWAELKPGPTTGLANWLFVFIAAPTLFLFPPLLIYQVVLIGLQRSPRMTKAKVGILILLIGLWYWSYRFAMDSDVLR